MTTVDLTPKAALELLDENRTFIENALHDTEETITVFERRFATPMLLVNTHAIASCLRGALTCMTAAMDEARLLDK